MSYVNAKGQVLAESGAPTNFAMQTIAFGVRNAPAGNNSIYSVGGDTINLNASGDNVLYLWGQSSTINAPIGGGTDTIYDLAYGGMTLPANIANLVLVSSTANFATGNSGNNILFGGAASATLDGGGGDDVLVAGSAPDVFRLQSGKGTAAIYGYRPGYDAVQLVGYGYASFAALMAKASQVGADTVISLSASDQVVLRGVAMAGLGPTDFDFPLPAVTVPASWQTVSGPTGGWNTNGWYVLNNAYNLSGLPAGTTTSFTAQFSTTTMPNGAVLTWNVPLSTSNQHTILAYPDVAYGHNPQTGPGLDPSDTAHVFPLQLGTLSSLTSNENVTLAGNAGGCNVAYDMWLTSIPGGGATTITNEVMVWVHHGSFAGFGSVVGHYVSPTGATATIYHQLHYTAVVFDNDQLAAKVDLGAVFTALEKLGLVSVNEYLDGIFFGSEVVSGKGRLTINNFDLTVSTTDPAGALDTRQALGAGTTITVTNPTPTASRVLDGSAGNSTVKAGNAGDKLVGGANDTLVGGAGADTFVFGGPFGHETVSGFTATGASHDTLQFSKSVFADWAHVLGKTVQRGNDLVIAADAADVLTLTNVALKNFTTLDVKLV